MSTLLKLNSVLFVNRDHKIWTWQLEVKLKRDQMEDMGIDEVKDVGK